MINPFLASLFLWLFVNSIWAFPITLWLVIMKRMADSQEFEQEINEIEIRLKILKEKKEELI